MYRIYRRFRRTVGKIILKVLAVIALVLTLLVATISQIMLVISRFLAFPIAALGLILAVIIYINAGFSADMLWIFGCSIAAIALYFILPLVSPALSNAISILKYYIREPIFIRSPVKYTM